MPNLIKSSQSKVLILASLGGMLEFYDFTIYGFFSVYFAEQFFPAHDKFVAIMASYAIFVLGYIARPIGGVLFSHIGDSIGRKVVLIITMFIMGLSSIGIAILPTYAQAGMLAPLLLLALRLGQGLAIGGEIPSTIVYVAEYMPERRAYAIGFVMAGVGAGLLLGAFINMLLTKALSSAQIYQFGWRVPFFIGGLLCFISYLIRKQLHDTHALDKNRHLQFPLIHLIKHQPKLVLTGAGLGAIAGTSTMLTLIFMPTYLISLVKVPAQPIANLLIAANALTLITSFLIGAIANHYNRYRLMQICLLWAILVTSSGYYALNQHIHLALAIIALGTLPGIFATMAPLLMSYLYPPEVRLTGVALSYNLGHTIFGGMAPLLITWLVHGYGLVALAPVSYFLLVSIISLIATLYAQKANARLTIIDKKVTFK